MRAAHGFVLPSPLVGLIGLVGLVFAASLNAACVREGAPAIAPVDVTIETGDAGAATTLVGSPPPATARDRCSAALRAGPIKTNPGCTLDERISQEGGGTLFYPCSGDGAVEAVFGEHRFQGKLTGTTLVLALETELDWDDGCHWETTQGIRGDWQRGSGTGSSEGAKRTKLSWSYSERPVSGTGCNGTCKASAEIQVAGARTDDEP